MKKNVLIEGSMWFFLISLFAIAMLALSISSFKLGRFEDVCTGIIYVLVSGAMWGLAIVILSDTIKNVRRIQNGQI